jgi:hypothetical protein
MVFTKFKSFKAWFDYLWPDPKFIACRDGYLKTIQTKGKVEVRFKAEVAKPLYLPEPKGIASY